MGSPHRVWLDCHESSGEHHLDAGTAQPVKTHVKKNKNTNTHAHSSDPCNDINLHSGDKKSQEEVVLLFQLSN